MEDRLVTWGQGPGFYVLPRRDAEWCIAIARLFDAVIWMTVTSQGFVQPLLQPRSWTH